MLIPTISLGHLSGPYTSQSGVSVLLQACTEMVMPICSDGHNDMFEVEVWNFVKYSETCYKKWKVWPDEKRALRMYGGKDISTATNIVFR
jgi:lysosomal Pro-X carboxypeptidase